MLVFPIIPTQAGTLSSNVDLTMAAVLGVTIFFSTLIAALIFCFAIRYHYKRPADRSNPPHFHLGLEITWTAIPLMIVLGLFLAGSRLFVQIRHAPADAVEMYVVGKQWMWKLQHPEGRREINELHIPVGYPIKLIMTSEDVIHSFFVPAFRVKQDVLPGRYTTMWFEATKAGEFHLFCAEYCGTSHAAMRGRIIAMPVAEYGQWLSGAMKAAGQGIAATQVGSDQNMVQAGSALFKTYRCDSCHKEDGSGSAPNLRGLFGKSVHLEGGQTTTANESYLRESILTPNARVVKGFQPNMPTFRGQITEDEILQLIAYIKSQGGTAGEPNKAANPERPREVGL
jgi:cytochrome c oxidase subunit II